MIDYIEIIGYFSADRMSTRIDSTVNEETSTSDLEIVLCFWYKDMPGIWGVDLGMPDGQIEPPKLYIASNFGSFWLFSA